MIQPLTVDSQRQILRPRVALVNGALVDAARKREQRERPSQQGAQCSLGDLSLLVLRREFANLFGGKQKKKKERIRKVI